MNISNHCIIFDTVFNCDLFPIHLLNNLLILLIDTSHTIQPRRLGINPLPQAAVLSFYLYLNL